MRKTLVVKLDSRKFESEDQEIKIINALTEIGLIHDGSDFGLEERLNRQLFFFYNDDLDFEVIEDIDEPIED